MEERPGTVSLADVARAAGVGVATASRALSQRGGLDISVATRNRVRDVADRLGYSPNRAARSLRTGRHHALGLVAPIQDWAWWAPVVEGAASAAADAGYHLVVQPADQNTDVPAVLALLGDLAVDGAIILTDRAVDSRFMLPAGLELVVVDDITASPVVPTVRGGNVEGGYAVGRHLRERGRSRPLVVHSDIEFAYVAERLEGFRRAFSEDGIQIGGGRLIRSSESMHPESAAPAELAREIDGRGAVDSVFATADFLAATVLRSLRLLGRAVPHDVAVVGYDDERVAAVVDPPLTTYRQPLGAMGAAAVNTLLARVAGQDVGTVQVLPGSLVIRQST